MTARAIHFVSLGCPKNRVDTEILLGVAEQAGFQATEDPAEAEVIVVNTCGFIGPAKQESIETVIEMARFKEEGRLQKLVVAGCLSQRYPHELSREMPEVDHLLGTGDMLRLADVLLGRAPRLGVGHAQEFLQTAAMPRSASQAPHSVYVKVAEGCSRKCAFCAIPSFRGTQRSRPIADVVAEVERLVARGAVEVNLIAQDTVSYGRDRRDGTNLAALVRSVAAVGGVRWLRLFYLYPESLTDELLDVWATTPNVVRYVDMPLQHASDRMLARMRRGHGGARIKKTVERLKERLPGSTLRTAFIAGHPGETDADFAELCRFVEWADFDRVGVFRYSKEEGTASAAQDGVVPARTAAARHRKLLALARRMGEKKARALVGQELEVLVDGPSEDHELVLAGRHRGQAPEVDGVVYLALGPEAADRPPSPGDLVRARITAAAGCDLLAEPLVDSLVARPPAPRRRSLPVLSA